ncbi:sensor histidine kinase [Malaciobacter mytili]|uniref:sensor histidine kinase n=1 Tax=Malaciobacter mytili TaxID=603050 RepID=UPI0013E908EC|nr:cache domain-containing protein [Malaciobacter mytili]
MSESKVEKRLLLIIKYAMPLATIIVSIIFTLFIVFNNIKEFKKESQYLKEVFIKTQKALVKSEVDRVFEQVDLENKKITLTLKNNIKRRVNEAYNISLNIYNEHKNTHTNEEIIKLIKDSLRKVNFNENRGYYFINDLNGYSVLYPPNKKIEGKNFYNIQDSNGFYTVRESIKLVKEQKEGFIEYSWKKPEDNKNFYKKISYIKLFEPLNLYIGTGEYLEDFKEKVKKEVILELQNLKYGLNGFVFLVDYNGVYLSHSKKEYVGKNRINLKDKNGIYITKEIINTAKKGDGFVKYISTVMPETNMPALKTTYIRGYKDWQLAIASGFYNEKIQEVIKEKEINLDKKNKEYIFKLISISLLITIILFISSLYVSTYLEKYFLKYKRKIYQEMEKNKQKDILLAHQTKMVAMGEMLENIAHQWRQPLSIITTSASGMQLNKELGLLTDESQNESIEVILSNAKHLSQTIDDFRDFLSNKKTKKEFDLSDAYYKTLKLINSKLKANEVEIINDIEEIKIESYENELIQVFMNLLNNSLDAFKIKNIQEKVISFSIYKEDDFAIIEYRDNAGGIEDSVISRIFEPYFTTKHKYNGTGIGLYMSQQIIIKQFNGDIKVENIKEKAQNIGVVFTIKIPIK